MIFVTVGTHTQSFNRILKEIDRLVQSKKIREDVIAQIGHSTYEPNKIKWFRFRKSIDDLYKNSRIVVCHGGAGSIIKAITNGTPTIAVPRYKRFGEHVNDHQIEIVRELEKEGKLTGVYDIKKLGDAILNIRKVKKAKKSSGICDEIDKLLRCIAIRQN